MLRRALDGAASAGVIAPSHSGNGETPQLPLARARGELVHKLLDALGSGAPRAALQRTMRREVAGTGLAQLFDAAWEEACRTLDEPSLAELAQPAPGARAYNELPLVYRDGEREVSGVLDRLVVSDDRACIIDYKTRQDATSDNAEQLATEHSSQLRLYAEGVRRLFPGRGIDAYVVFTACNRAVRVAVDDTRQSATTAAD
jgi:ATP-dependent helicase/nuclease subunit A